MQWTQEADLLVSTVYVVSILRPSICAAKLVLLVQIKMIFTDLFFLSIYALAL